MGEEKLATVVLQEESPEPQVGIEDFLSQNAATILALSEKTELEDYIVDHDIFIAEAQEKIANAVKLATAETRTRYDLVKVKRPTFKMFREQPKNAESLAKDWVEVGKELTPIRKEINAIAKKVEADMPSEVTGILYAQAKNAEWKKRVLEIRSELGNEPRAMLHV